MCIRDRSKASVEVNRFLFQTSKPELSMETEMCIRDRAIARVNRVFKDKEGGLIVDYVGIASALKAAMKMCIRDRI